MKQAPSKVHINNVVRSAELVRIEITKGKWVPARPLGNHYSYPARLKLAWAVFTGKADALFYEDQ